MNLSLFICFKPNENQPWCYDAVENYLTEMKNTQQPIYKSYQQSLDILNRIVILPEAFVTLDSTFV